jgi:hypothetical protein
VKILVYSLLAPDIKLDGSVILTDATGAGKYAAELDLSKLAQLKVVKIGTPSVLSNQKARDNEASNAHVYGADEATERLVLLNFGADDYGIGITLFRYGDNWKVVSQSSPLAGTTSTGGAVKTTPDQFSGQLGGN